MKLLPGWDKRLARLPAPAQQEHRSVVLPKDPDYYAQRPMLVGDLLGAHDMVALAHQRPLSHIGFQVAFAYDRPGVRIDAQHTVEDPRSLHPLFLSLVLVEPGTPPDEDTQYAFVVDLRHPDLYPAIATLLRLPLPFVGHDTKTALFCLWHLGLPEPQILWDTWVHEKAASLGRAHVHYTLSVNADEAEHARVKAQAEEDDRFTHALLATCQRYGVPYRAASTRPRLQALLRSHPEGTPLTEEQTEAVVADAIAPACLYLPQVAAATRMGILHHLVSVEMPWTITNARMEWHGVRIDPIKRRKALEACTRHLCRVTQQLADYGITNVQSYDQLTAFFGQLGLLPLFRRTGRYAFDRKQLRLCEDRHPAIPLIRVARRILDVQASQILRAELVGADGRVHPDHRQLGARTGRQTSRWPNILGLEGVLRPLIVPAEGYSIGEVDWSQIEIGIAAAVYHDARLIEMFNTGDVYAAMAQHFYQHRLSPKDRRLSGQQFKRKHPQLRDRMKTCTLGIINGMTPQGIASLLNLSQAKAEALQKQFMTMFPQLQQALQETAAYGAIRGYATTVSGLRRYRARNGQASIWERNWLANYPLQGSAAVLFKAAGNRLDQLYRPYDAWLLIPLHDAFVFEAPLDVLQEVADLTDRIMCETVREYFPELRPRTEINLIRPDCWNKEGDANVLTRWLQNPLAVVKASVKKSRCGVS